MGATSDSRLATYTNRSVIDRIAMDEGVPRDTAELWFKEALKFLELATELEKSGERPFNLVPSAPVDAAWHAFILHTRDYADYCERKLGGFAHHNPSKPETDDAIASQLLDYLRTRVSMNRRYGELNDELWPLP
jgi:hypothetical protein